MTSIGRIWWTRAGVGNERGMTVLELLVASFISLVFVCAAGTSYLVNQKAYRQNDNKRILQQTTSQVMEIMERAIRGAAKAVIVGGNQVTLYDASGAQTAQFRLAASSGVNKLFQQSTVLAPQRLTALSFTPNSDTTVVQVYLELQDDAFNKVAVISSAALRNHRKLRNLSY